MTWHIKSPQIFNNHRRNHRLFETNISVHDIDIHSSTLKEKSKGCFQGASWFILWKKVLIRSWPQEAAQYMDASPTSWWIFLSLSAIHSIIFSSSANISDTETETFALPLYFKTAWMNIPQCWQMISPSIEEHCKSTNSNWMFLQNFLFML